MLSGSVRVLLITVLAVGTSVLAALVIRLVLPDGAALAVSAVIGTAAGLAAGTLIFPELRRRAGEREPADPVDQRRIDWYAAVLRDSRHLASIPVWPAHDAELAQAHTALTRSADDALFLATPAVSKALHTLMTRADTLVSTVTTLRRETRPTRDDTVDQRRRNDYDQAHTAVNEALLAFRNAARTHLGVPA